MAKQIQQRTSRQLAVDRVEQAYVELEQAAGAFVVASARYSEARKAYYACRDQLLTEYPQHAGTPDVPA